MGWNEREGRYKTRTGKEEKRDLKSKRKEGFSIRYNIKERKKRTEQIKRKG